MFKYRYLSSMHLTKRLSWLTLIFSIPLNLLLPSYGRDIAIEVFNDSSVFSDTDDHWANLFIDGIGTEGLMRGYLNGIFRPDRTMTRSEFAAVMIQAFPNAPSLREGRGSQMANFG